MSAQGALASFVRSAISRLLPIGWLYLPKGVLQESTECLFYEDDEFDSLKEREATAARLGFPVEGLDTQTIEDVCQGALRLDPQASDALLVRAFSYYHRFDAFLPSLDAGDPPPADQVLLNIDRQFYESLGDEKPGTTCREEGCNRGMVRLSAFCRKHHFENVQKRPCPFE